MIVYFIVLDANQRQFFCTNFDIPNLRIRGIFFMYISNIADTVDNVIFHVIDGTKCEIQVIILEIWLGLGKVNHTWKGIGCKSYIGINPNDLMASKDYVLLEETQRTSDKDTALLLAAGSQRVHWLRSLYTSLDVALEEFLKTVPKRSIIICESNSLRNLVEPGCFLMLKNTRSDKIKPTAAEIIHFADAVVENDFKDSIKNAAENVNIIDKVSHLSAQFLKA
jgi:hypothetical protein